MNDGATDDWRLLYLFSGPSRPLDGLATFAEELGGSCTCMDIEIDGSRDLVDLNAWEAVYATLQDYDAYMMAPPCSTFTPARNADDGGPKPLRAASGPDRYGFRNLDKYDKQKVQEGNVLAIRSSQTGEFASDHHKPWMLEQPHRRPGKTSMLNLDEIDRLLTRPDVRIITLAQCRFGAEAEKLTDLVTNIAEEDTRHLQLLCNHPSQWWIIPWSGESLLTTSTVERDSESNTAGRLVTCDVEKVSSQRAFSHQGCCSLSICIESCTSGDLSEGIVQAFIAAHSH